MGYVVLASGVYDMAGKKINILDTTLREGELNSSVYYTLDKFETIGSALVELGTPRIEFSIAYPQRGKSIGEMRDVLKTIQGGTKDSIIIVQCRALREDVEIAQKMEVDGCGVYLAISEEHRNNKLRGISVEDTVTRFTESLDVLKECGFKYRRAVLEDASRFFSKSKSVEDHLYHLKKIIEETDRAGATNISLPDTAGLLEEDEAIEMFEFANRITDKELSAHFHNDYGNALGNTKAVIKRGLVSEPHVSIYGLGAGAGITDHYELSSNLLDNSDIKTGENRGSFLKLYKTFESTTKIPIPWNHPLSDFARTEKAGTHQAQQLNNPEGYIPQKKLEYDFNNRVIFDIGEFVSERLIKQLLKTYEVNDSNVKKIINLIVRRSALLNRKLYNREIRNLIYDVINVKISTALISQYVGPEEGFYLLKVKPQSTSDITEKIENIKGVEKVLETYGIYDIIIEAYTDNNMQKVIEGLVGKDMIEISPLIVG